MAAIKLQQFRGVRPRLGHRQLDDREATTAINLRLGSGELRALRGTTTDEAWVKAGDITSFFPMEFEAGRKWLHWVADVDVLRGPVPNDSDQRVYFTGDGQPKMTYNDLVDAAVGTAGEYPRDWRYLGMPAPSNVLTVDATEFGTEGVITEVITPELTFLFEPRLDAVPVSIGESLKLLAGGTRQTFTIFPPGSEYLVEASNENTLRLYTLDGGQYLTEAVEALEGWSYADGTGAGTQLDGSLALPNGISVSVPGHGLRDGDVIRITSTTAPLSNQFQNGWVSPEFSVHEELGQEPRFILSATDEKAVVDASADGDDRWTGSITYSVIRDESTASGRVVERTYIYTYVSPLGEEGPPSDPSLIVSTVEADSTGVTGFSVPTLTKRDIEFVRLYRANNSSTDAEFQFVDEIAATLITDYTPVTGADTDYGGTISLTGVPVALDGTTENTLVATDPASSIKTRRDTPVTLTLQLSDTETQLAMPTRDDAVAPNWQVEFQYSTNGSLWITIGTKNALGTASNTQEDTVPVTYTRFFNIDATITQEFDIAAAPVSKDDDVQYRAIVTLVNGDYNTPTADSFTVAEAAVTEPGEVGPAEYVYTDTDKDDDLGEVIQSVEWFPPDATMHGLVSMPNGILAGFFGRTVAFCEPYFPHAWPPSYEIHLDYDVVGLGVFGNSLLICTTGTPYVVSGTHSRNMRAGLRRIEVSQACVSKDSIANIGSGVLYASPDGLAYASNSDFQIVTDGQGNNPGFFSREEWQALNPETIIGFAHDQRYIAFFDDGGGQRSFVFDPARPEVGLVFTEVTTLGGYEDLLTDTLYLTDGNNRLTWDTGAALTYTWKSKLFAFPYPVNLAFGRVVADAYPVTFKLHANGVLRHTRSVTSDEEFRLPAGYLGDRYYVEVEGTSPITALFVGETVDDMLEG